MGSDIDRSPEEQEENGFFPLTFELARAIVKAFPRTASISLFVTFELQANPQAP